MKMVMAVSSAGPTLLREGLSAAMTAEAAKRFEATAAGQDAPTPDFSPVGLEEVAGKYDTVCCLDVMIHYPQEKADGMVQHLASISKDRLIISFAPKTLACKCPIHTVKPRRACCCD